MKIDKLPTEFIKALPIIKKIEEAGYEAYFVGGSVRDIILDHKIHDVDIATSAFPEEVKQIFPKTIDVGIEHGTVLVLFDEEQYEITTFRTESTYQDYRRPDEVTFVRSLEEDLKRRDFTMNALAMNKDGIIIDHFNGIEAIKNRVIVAVGDASERFNEDALRMMRGLRFASQLSFSIEEKTLQAIQTHHSLLSKISVERIYVEWIKLLMGESRNQGLRLFTETGCFSYCPGFKNKESELNNLLLLDDRKVIENEIIAWLLICYSLKIKDTSLLLKGWKASNRMIIAVKEGVFQLKNREVKEWQNLDLYQAGREIVSYVEQVRFIMNQSSDEKLALQLYEELAIKSIKDLSVGGKELLTYLDKTPGPWLGKTLAYLEKQVVQGNLLNEKNSLLKAAETFIKEES
ncbi:MULTISPECIES: CCA tRNA nucleotidyltransferase [Vagococcus]|uniref:CCA-adding enzyme n=1 Tax=Vagococcus fluvialis bH819 TaxID=1255619 RepID=A0A1X6WN07_9ENTE|nr:MULTISPECIES: CCA tRNA nucleotidyltransferase [Vagococcus]SLM85704.1 tRNA nucleotidyltransferase [Vagococcus fluvialis bH819]HCM90126.1 CCA tRNA nucleotidyltransferase [Vagococcus sp.]